MNTPTTPSTSLINAAARMAAKWWGQRLHRDHADKREAFEAALRDLTRRTLLGEIWWEFGKSEPKPCDGKPLQLMHLESDYDPEGPLLKAVRDTVAPDCRGCMFSSDGILPIKTDLRIDLREIPVLMPKEGYGNWTAHIPITVLPEDEA